MALITVNAVVHIPTYIRVTKVAGVIAAMAACALEDRVVTAIRVASGALAVCVAMVGWKPRVVGVWERRPGPVRCAHAVAGPALSNREERDVCPRGMGWVRCAVIVGLMT